MLVARIAPHFWEEPVISGTRGAGTVFFSGCNMRCVFCQNREISAGLKGEAVDAAALERHIRAMLAQGVHNVEFVTPSHYALFLADFLETHRYEVPVVWNSSGYDSTAVLEQLRGKVQVFLPDLKYADAALARRYGAAPDYVQTAREALEKTYALGDWGRRLAEKGRYHSPPDAAGAAGKHPCGDRCRARFCKGQKGTLFADEPIHALRRFGALPGAAAHD